MSAEFKPYDFQQEDLDKVFPLNSALIGSEMGCGKTLETVWLDDLWSSANSKTLVVGTLTGLRTTWERWFKKIAPDVKTFVIDPKNKPAFEKAVRVGTHQVYIVHWEALRLLPSLTERVWNFVVVDECHRMKNRKAQQTKALKKIRTVRKLALSGTAADNRPADIWSVLNWLYPLKFGSYWRFYKEYIDYEIIYPQGFHKIKGIKSEKLSEFHDLLDPFYIRHLKREGCCPHHPEGVMPWLPDKYYTPIYVELTPPQRKAYDQMKNDLLAWVGENEDKAVPAPVAIAQLQRLQQFAATHMDVIVNPKYDSKAETGRNSRPEMYVMSEPSSKLDAVMDIIEQMEGESVVVFSQFKQVINLLASRLESQGISYGLITGDVKDTDRARCISEFQEGRLQVIAGTIAAGGVGIDLFKASRVVFVDRAWSPAMNKQAEDRLWRDGQQNAVQVIDIIARNTVDLGRHQQLEQKWQWLRQVLGDTNTMQTDLEDKAS